MEYSRLCHKSLHHIGLCGLCSYVASMFCYHSRELGGMSAMHLDRSICSYVNTTLKFHSVTLTVKVISGLKLLLLLTDGSQLSIQKFLAITRLYFTDSVRDI